MPTSPILNKNLDCIERYNPKLKQDLLAMSYLTNSIQLIETDLNEPNLTFNGLPLHNPKGAELEAKGAFEKIENNPLMMHVIFGMGLGHLFQEFCNNSKGTVFLYEPNMEILRVTLELVDFSKELSQNNVFIFTDMQSFKECFINHYKHNANCTFTFLGSYKQIYGDKMDEIFKQVENIMGSCIVDYNTLKKEGVRSVIMTLNNLAYSLEGTPIHELRGTYRGKTALIVSAGPSLDQNIETIKKNRDKVVIFCVGTAFKALANNGITPDFLNIIEINDCSGQVKGFDLSDINLILEPYTHTSIFKLNVKNKLLFPTNTAHANNYWASITGVDISPYLSKGTVSNESLVCAKMLGCTKIILVGQDLAYLNNQCYSSGAAYSELVFDTNSQTGRPEFRIRDYDKYVASLLPVGTDITQPWCKDFAEYKIRNLNDTLYFVKGISGEMLPTQGGYSVFIEYFREFAYFNQDLDLINSSMIGAQIDGFRNVPLDRALENNPVIEKVELSGNFKYDKKKILNDLVKEREVLKGVLKEFDTAKEYLFKYEREYNRRRLVTEDAAKYFKLLFALYDKINNQNQDALYQVISFKERIEIQFKLRESEVFTLDTIKNLYVLLKDYFVNVETNVSDVLDIIEKQIGMLSESFSTAG